MEKFRLNEEINGRYSELLNEDVSEETNKYKSIIIEGETQDVLEDIEWHFKNELANDDYVGVEINESGNRIRFKFYDDTAKYKAIHILESRYEDVKFNK